MLTTLLPPTAGTARVAGFDVVREGPRVRAAIGAALQEAALDPFLTGREHMRLQTGDARHAARPSAPAAATSCSSASASPRRPTGSVGGYSGGMKRRLDLALALVHGPRILFLDEPTTGLDIQSRSALWDEVARLAADDGVTVFLTTQYLEEADVLADRVGIIDHGAHRGRGHAGGAEGGDRPAHGRGRPGGSGASARRPRACSRASASRRGRQSERRPRRRAPRAAARPTSPRSCARSTPRTSRSPTSSSTQPTLDDVFLAKTGRSLEGAGDEEDEEDAAARSPARPRPYRRERDAAHPGRRARAPVGRAHPAPAGAGRPRARVPLLLLAVNSGGLDAATRTPGLPDRLLPDLRARASRSSRARCSPP